MTETELVRSGRDARLGLVKMPDGSRISAHRHATVYGEMLLQCCRDYSTLPDPRSLEQHEIEFFFRGLRKDLQRATKKK